VGGGLGISVPHVDVETAGGKTFEYQLTGPALMLAAGASYDLSDRWAVFGEYKFTYSVNQAELASGGTLDTDIVTNALNIGVTYKF
jgi:lipid A oxidase